MLDILHYWHCNFGFVFGQKSVKMFQSFAQVLANMTSWECRVEDVEFKLVVGINEQATEPMIPLAILCIDGND